MSKRFIGVDGATKLVGARRGIVADEHAIKLRYRCLVSEMCGFAGAEGAKSAYIDSESGSGVRALDLAAVYLVGKNVTFMRWASVARSLSSCVPSRNCSFPRWRYSTLTALVSRLTLPLLTIFTTPAHRRKSSSCLATMQRLTSPTLAPCVRYREAEVQQ